MNKKSLSFGQLMREYHVLRHTERTLTYAINGLIREVCGFEVEGDSEEQTSNGARLPPRLRQRKAWSGLRRRQFNSSVTGRMAVGLYAQSLKLMSVVVISSWHALEIFLADVNAERCDGQEKWALVGCLGHVLGPAVGLPVP
jgi:hypothetical protein